jgi:thiol-disulfide isomerase/thioredoxin
MRRLSLVLAPLALAVVAAAAFYGTKPQTGKGACPAASVALADKLRPLAKGEVAALAVAPRLATPVAFAGPDGQKLSLADFKGRAVLLNLWATWCVPCRKEMPALDTLEGKLGGPGFEVVAVNIDTRESDKPHAWLEAVGVSRLAYYADPSAKVFQDMKLIGLGFGLPTTLLVDPSGCEIGNVAGPAEWASQDGLDLVRAAIGG